MNIFVLDENPEIAATYMCDKHVVKMVTETAQILCTAISSLDSTIAVPYRPTHRKHPAVLWTAKSRENIEWLIAHGTALNTEYMYRYNKEICHKSFLVIDQIRRDKRYHKLNFEASARTQFAQCMPDVYKRNDVVQAYRAYYLGEKAAFARWTKRNTPSWWTEFYAHAHEYSL